MKFKFNGGYGAILCERCGVILKEGNQIPEYVWEAVKNGTIKDLPNGEHISFVRNVWTPVSANDLKEDSTIIRELII